MENLFFINFGTAEQQTILWYSDYYRAKEHFNTISLDAIEHVILCDKDGLMLMQWNKAETQQD